MSEPSHNAPPIDTKITIVIPTYRREAVLVETLRQLVDLSPAADELIVVDQTAQHEPPTQAALKNLHDQGVIRWLHLDQPSIPVAMNVGLLEALNPIVLFLDDDIQPDPALVEAHRYAQLRSPGLIAGQVLQPGEHPNPPSVTERFRFSSTEVASIAEFMGGNFSIPRDLAIELGGFDENFVGAAYRFEAEFAYRYVQSHGLIGFRPQASINHLAVSSGGTRAYGHHLRTLSPAHAVGAYYYLMRCRPPRWLFSLTWRPLRSIRTRFHLTHPWWIPVTFLAELRGFMAAFRLCLRGPRLLTPGVQAASA